MEPNDYFPALYLEDLKGAYSELPNGSGPIEICGGIFFDNLCRPDAWTKLISPISFICCLYTLNLIHQGIYSHRYVVYNQWIERCVPFLRSTCVYHGGVIYPYDHIEYVEAMLLKYANNTKLIDRSIISKYAKYMFYSYLPSLQLNPFRVEFLIEYLTKDTDCQEVNALFS
ncbi:MAG: hypothetical protein KZQ96_13450 [Candidatus Thiodiazotropha sp. (ex Lucinoma borealis)]|nr:hypothetical protein [Candidatus Thiodiazotropha sp. (ex Lucinoma borealis)]